MSTDGFIPPRWEHVTYYPYEGHAQKTTPAPPEPEEIGLKFDTDKPDYSLTPWAALEEVVKVLTYGAKKYSRDNWQHVTPFKERYLAAALRHIVAYARGETIDPESGLHHLAHAATSLCYLTEKDMAKAHESP